MASGEHRPYDDATFFGSDGGDSGGLQHMNVTVALNHRFVGDASGNVYSPGGMGIEFWNRYLGVFDSVTVLARVDTGAPIAETFDIATNDRIRFIPVPQYVGPGQYFARRTKVRRAISEAFDESQAIIGRVPSPIASGLLRMARRAHKPYGVDVVADPWDYLGPGANQSPLRPFARRIATRQLKTECRYAHVAAYVTSQALQRSYPPGQSTISDGISDVRLPQSAIRDRPRVFEEPVNRLIAVGHMSVTYKGYDVLLKALQMFSPENRPRLRILGDGRMMETYRQLSSELGLSEAVEFCGRVASGDAILAMLDDADVFVMPSRQEGLPRAMLEAMGRGLPCIGTTVGGVPEILDPSVLIPPGNIPELHAAIRSLIGDTDRLNALSERNLATSRTFASEETQLRADRLFQNLHEATSRFLGSSQSQA